MKSNTKRPPEATTANAEKVESNKGLASLVTLLLSPIRRHRVAHAPVKSSPSAPLAAGPPINSPTVKTSTGKPEKRTMERRKSLQAMLGSDAVFNSFVAVAQKVFNVPLAVVCHVQSGPGVTKGGSQRSNQSSPTNLVILLQSSHSCPHYHTLNSNTLSDTHLLPCYFTLL